MALSLSRLESAFPEYRLVGSGGRIGGSQEEAEVVEIRSWFMKLVSGRTSGRDEAMVSTGDGRTVLKISPAVPTTNPEDLKEFEANARMAVAGLRMYHAMQRLLVDAMDAGLPSGAASIREAYAAMEAARPARFDVSHDGRRRFTGTRDECCAFVIRDSGMSYQGAIEVGGYAVTAVALRPLSDEEKADIAEGIMAEEERRLERVGFGRR